ncbi:MAG TPA: hypothetical protein VD905_02030 [Flavobacteriales bacterium]|nr:hypothetical protein [Flavobacteriales bacterium]
MKKIVGMGMLAVLLTAASPAFATGKGDKAKKQKCSKAKTCVQKPCDKPCEPSKCTSMCPPCCRH